MKLSLASRNGGQILVDQLKIHAVDLAFCVPGESYLPVLDALYDARDRIRLFTCRHEGGATNMADAYGKLTGRPGVCFVTRGPGATHASVGIHTARQDDTPLILFIGQVKRGHQGRDAFQEIDFRQMFGPLTKWVDQIDDPRRIPEMVSRAFHLAVSGRPGPVVLALPEDMLSETCVVADGGPYRRIQATPGSAQMAALHERLAQAERPLMILGGSDWTPQAVANIRAFAEANQLPTIATLRRQDLFDNRAALYLGDLGLSVDPALTRRVQAADTLLVVGDRLSEFPTGGYTLLDIPRPRQTFMHVYPDAHELGRVYQPDVAIVSGMPEFAAAARALPAVDGGRWSAWAEAGRLDYLANLRPPEVKRGVDFGAVLAYLRDNLPPDTIFASGAGSYTGWCNRFYQFSVYPSQLAPTSGSMGYGFPAAVAAKAVFPDRLVVDIAGDGCFLMTSQELATAMQYSLNVIVLVINNSALGSILLHQERVYPGRRIGTELVNPDFVAYARAFGAYGELVERTEDFAAAFDRARAANRPALLELRTDPEYSTPRARLSALRG